MLLLWFIVLILLTAWMTLAWVVQRAARNAGWVDVFWTFGTGVGCAICALWPLRGAPAMPGRQWLVAGLAIFWAVRLGGYIALRVAKEPKEDVRYTEFRSAWGADFQRRMSRFVIVQGPIAAILSGAALVAAHAPAAFPDFTDLLGLLVFVAGIAVEAVADWQMRRFRAAAQGRQVVCDQGLWARSRHPNYFGEWLVWWTYPIIAIGAGNEWGWLALAAPALMYWLLVHVSGVPPLEQSMLATRGAAFSAYQARVPEFFPRLFRSSK